MKLETKIVLKRNSIALYFKREYYFTGLSITNENEWSAKQNNFTSKRKDYETDRIFLNQLKNQHDNLINEATLLGIKEGKEVRAYIENHFKRIELGLSQNNQSNEIVIAHAYNEFWQTLKRESNKFTKRSIQKYTTHELTLTEFCNQYKKQLLIQIDYNFVLDFRLYLSKENIREVETKQGNIKKVPILGLRNKTLKVYMGNLFTYLRWCEERYNITFDKRIFKIKTNSETHTNRQNAGLALTNEMYEELKAYKPNHAIQSQNEAEIKTRDYVIFLCNTGLRYSDFKQLNKSDIVKRGNDYFINKIQVKTKNFVGLKLNKTALEILKKYNFNFSEIVRTNQKANETIKDILKHLPSCQIKKRIFKEWLDREVMEEEYFYNLFTLHKTRHTFVSRLLRAGASPASIQKATGWSKLEMINIYMDIESSSEGNAVDLLD